MKSYLITLLPLCILLVAANCQKEKNPGPTASISDITPTSGAANTVVTIIGHNFGTDVSKVSVLFNGTGATVQTITDTQIIALAPDGATTGNVDVVINGQTLTGPVFTYVQAPKWRLKSVIYNYSSSALQHVVFFYNERGMINKIGRGLSGIKDTLDIGVQEQADVKYDSIDRVSFIGSYKVVHISATEIQEYPYPHYASDGIGTYYVNANGHNELNSRVSYYPKESKFPPPGISKTLYNYNPLGGLQSRTDVTTDLDNTHSTTQLAWAFYGNGLSSATIANPFRDLPLEQRLVHYMNPLFRFGDWDMLGPSWSNGIFELYTYKNGDKEVSGYFGNDYKVDSNGNVVTLTTYGKEESKFDPNTNWRVSGNYWIRYEQY